MLAAAAAIVEDGARNAHLLRKIHTNIVRARNSAWEMQHLFNNLFRYALFNNTAT
jgi:hypothetical protein